MSKPLLPVVFGSVAIVAVAALTGCSATSLPGGSAQAASQPGASASPTKAAVPPEDDLTAVPKDCPKASEVSALVGFTVPDPDRVRSSAGLACTYAGADPTHDMEINFHSAPSGTTAATVRAELASGNSEGAVISPVSGLGDAAFSGVLPQGGAALLVWNKGVEFSVVDVVDLDGLRRVALGILSD
jgi:hypothetical protein